MIDAEVSYYLPYVTVVPVAYLAAFLAALAGVVYSLNTLLAMPESFAKSGGSSVDAASDGRRKKKVNFLENVMPSKHLLKDAQQRSTSNMTITTEYGDHLLLPYDETCDHLLGLDGHIVDTGDHNVGHARVHFKDLPSETNFGKVEDRKPQSGKLGKTCANVPEDTAKLEIPPSKNISNFKFPTKRQSNLKLMRTKYDSNLLIKIPLDSAELRRAPKLSTQCAEKSHEKLADEMGMDEFRESVVDLQCKGFVMRMEEAQTGTREDDHLLDLSSSIYNLFRSPPLSYLNPSSSKEADSLDDTDSVIHGLGDLNELREAESILSFDGDLQNLPYYRPVQLVNSLG